MPGMPRIPRPLARDEVHLWYAMLDRSQAELDLLAAVLAADERARADALGSIEARHRFVASRGLLRILLSSYLRLAPNLVQLTTGPHGKPRLAVAPTDLRFNLSHADGVALYVLADGRELGVDMECERRLPHMERMASRFFHTSEVEALRSLAPEQRSNAFLRCWTRKEAYLKALGSGLARPLNTFAVSLVAAHSARLLLVEGAPGEVERWRLADVETPSGCVGALAVEGADWVVVNCGSIPL